MDMIKCASLWKEQTNSLGKIPGEALRARAAAQGPYLAPDRQSIVERQLGRDVDVRHR